MRALLLAAALVACTPRVPAVEPDTMPLPWCFRVMVRHAGRPQVLAACATDVDTCEVLRELARRRGALAGIAAVGACR